MRIEPADEQPGDVRDERADVVTDLRRGGRIHTRVGCAVLERRAARLEQRLDAVPLVDDGTHGEPRHRDDGRDEREHAQRRRRPAWQPAAVQDLGQRVEPAREQEAEHGGEDHRAERQHAGDEQGDGDRDDDRPPGDAPEAVVPERRAPRGHVVAFLSSGDRSGPAQEQFVVGRACTGLPRAGRRPGRTLRTLRDRRPDRADAPAPPHPSAEGIAYVPAHRRSRTVRSGDATPTSPAGAPIVTVWTALFWGAFSSAALFLGQALAGPLGPRTRTTGLLMGFGAGTLLSAVGLRADPGGEPARRVVGRDLVPGRGARVLRR